MKHSVQTLVWLYDLLLKLYPRQYRAEYGEEMRCVFRLIADETARQGALPLIRLSSRELFDLPGAVVREHWRAGKSRKMNNKLLYLFAAIILTIACWPIAYFLWGFGSPVKVIVTATVGGLSASALAWAARRVSYRGWVYAGLFILAGLFLPASVLSEDFPDDQSTLFLILSAALVIAAFLLHSGLHLYRQLQNAGAVEGRGSQPQRKFAGRTATVVLVLSALLLTKALYNLYWSTVWDNTTDSLGYFWLVFPVAAALYSGAVISITLPGGTKLAGLLYALLIPALMIAVSTGAQSVDFFQLTEDRAGQVSQAIEAYYARKGSYPQDLRQLTPGYVLSLPGPVLLFGQDWCYEGGSDYYRLGAVYREHWSNPFITARVYASAGNPPEPSEICGKELSETRSQYAAKFNAVPTPVPLPTSAVSIPRTAVEPVLRAESLSVGNWSPDGAYLVFGLTAYYGELGGELEIDLHFLDAKTGQVCPASRPKWMEGWRSGGLRAHYTWLPDGRGLYVSDAGEMVVLTPCMDGVQELTGRYPVTFTQAVAFDEQSGGVLLKNPDAYWLLDGTSLEARQVPGITPGPAELQWSWGAWSPGGERLAISLLEQADTGATLYIVNGATGQVESSLPLQDASEANLPIVEWLTRYELLVHGSSLIVIDLGADPPETTDLIRDVFLLDIALPTDISSMDSLPNPTGDGYYLGVRVNQPHNQGVYLYASETDRVETFQHDTDTLFFFPGGQWMRLPKWEDSPTYRDEYEMGWLDQPGETHRLVVEATRRAAALKCFQDICLLARNWFSVPRKAFRWFRFPTENWSVSGNWRAQEGTPAT